MAPKGSAGRSKSASPTKQAHKGKGREETKLAGEEVPQTQQPRLLSFSNDSDSILHSSPSPPRKAASSSQPVRTSSSSSSSSLSTNGRNARRSLFSSQQPRQLPLRNPGKAKARSSASVDDAIVISGSDEESYEVLHTSSRSRPQAQRHQETQAPRTPSSSTQLWADRYHPESSETLAVHRGKVDAVRKWLEEALDGPPSLRAYRRLLVLTGPSGSGKSATIKALSSVKDLNFEIVEWENSSGSSWNDTSNEYSSFPSSSTSVTRLFADFLASSSRFGVLNLNADDEAHDVQQNGSSLAAFKLPSSRAGLHSYSATKQETSSMSMAPSASQRLMPPPPVPRKSSEKSASSSPSLAEAKNANHRRVIVLDDLPNLSHLPTRMTFQSTLAALLSHTHAQAKQFAGVDRGLGLHSPPPIVLLLSDSTGRESDASIATDALVGRSQSFGWRRDEELNIRTVLGDELRRDPRVSEIKYNPVAPTILKKALVRVLDLVHTSLPTPSSFQTSNTHMPARKASKSKKASAAHRDKAFETELVKLLCAATDDGAAFAGEPQSRTDKAAGKRKAIERSTGGDLRSAITQMQFALEHSARSYSGSALKGSDAGARLKSAGVKRDRAGKALPLATEDAKIRARRLLAVTSRRESNLPLFHAVGRVLYNKRAGDPGGSDDEGDHNDHVSTQLASKTGRQRTVAEPKKSSDTNRCDVEDDEQNVEMDDWSDDCGQNSVSKSVLRDTEDGQPWTQLPPHLSHLHRRPSKISAEALWAQSPVDPSLLQLYLHHNFPSFCADIEQCSASLDYISAADSELRILTESWTHSSLSAYYSFLVTTGGILLSLPSPIPPVSGGQGLDQSSTSRFNVSGRSRHRQIRKSAFFDAYHRTRDMNDALEEAQAWLLGSTSDRVGAEHGKSFPRARNGNEGPGADLTSLISVPRSAMATEVAPLLAKLNAIGGSTDRNRNWGSRHFEASNSGINRSHRLGRVSASSSAEGSRARDLTAALATIGTFEHLTASQAAESAFALRTGAIEDNGLLGGAEGEQTEEDDQMVWHMAGSLESPAGTDRNVSAGTGQDGRPSLIWEEQDREQVDTAGEPPASTEDPVTLDDGVGLMDSEDEVVSDDGEWT
ncbi:RFC checkpoint protein Rad17 [Tilletia horrida]|uniref:RFC checkpoint protein Rad17 n=1 Tax=Tilletia horrida TaxID=155126 RepID=A0AAN6JT89_9BASI|nr:RFC checkpoint protein Rad17 [Tilletia horrida]